MLADICCLLVCYCQLISDDYCWQNNTYVCCLQLTTVLLGVTWCRLLADMCCMLWSPTVCGLLLTEWCLPGSAALLYTSARLYYILLLLLIAAGETDPCLVTSFSCFHGFYLILFVICCLIPALPFFWMLTNHGRRFLPSWNLLPTVRFLAFCLMLSVTDCLKLLIFDLNWEQHYKLITFAGRFRPQLVLAILLHHSFMMVFWKQIAPFYIVHSDERQNTLRHDSFILVTCKYYHSGNTFLVNIFIEDTFS